ncbi:MAG: hypothetical protein L0196_08580 [candidate division Zixibacteria bacterium]|nr:hypothetical protein [candidate division Zixibacteria bacterium]
MANDKNSAPSAFVWNAGGWFGSQVGSTVWMLILGFVLLSKDALAAWVCFGGFLVLNAWGLYLWRSRERLSVYAGLQRFLAAATVVIALVVVVVNERGASQPPAPGALVSTYLPYWVILAAPALMLLFFLREREANRKRTAEIPQSQS